MTNSPHLVVRETSDRQRRHENVAPRLQDAWGRGAPAITAAVQAYLWTPRAQAPAAPF